MKKHRQKEVHLEYLRAEKQHFEFASLDTRPKISAHSQELVSRMQYKGVEKMHRTYYETERQKEESRMMQVRNKEMEGVTYRPSINH
jgi:hypothetical protein